MESIDLALDTDNELNFMVTVEGSRPGESSCRFFLEGSEMSYIFPGRIDQSGEVSVNIPSMNKLLREGIYKSKLEVVVEDRVFIPLEMNINFEKSVRVTAESVARVKKKPKASATLISASKPLPTKQASESNSSPPPDTVAAPISEKKLSPPQKPITRDDPKPIKMRRSSTGRKQVSLGELNETELRELIRNTFLQKK